MKKFNWISAVSITAILAISTIFISFKNGQLSTDLSATYHPEKEFNDYWYQNSAEITRFDLKQARYGEIRDGEAVMIFVSEHLSPQEHIKAYNRNGKDIPVLKLNFMRNFKTGLYPYSVMSSIFTPVDIKSNPHSLRNTFSMQEWCGHVFSMIDLGQHGLSAKLHSYFPNEGDKSVELDKAFQEDEIWNTIRIDHLVLPIGEISIIPSMQHLRFAHLPIEQYTANASKTLEGNSLKYTVDYKQLNRKFSVWFKSEHPFSIIKWEEEVRSGFGSAAKILKTEAVAKSTKMLPYWTKNANSDSYLREEMGFE
ncbi:MAG: septum formation inhibitor Maf [Chitinophagales bacterium]|nr:septum formation inhibitor Maf [Chitinophagales bacterium]